MSKTKLQLNIDEIETPVVSVSQNAQWQIANMLKNDPYLNNKYLRISIDGKGCDGFTYAIGFTEKTDKDMAIEIEVESYHSEEPNIKTFLLMDAFAAFYLQMVKIDYDFDSETDQDGFTVQNLNQKDFHGKFWRKDKTKTPPETMYKG